MRLSKIKHPSGGDVIFDRISGFLSPEKEDAIEEYFLTVRPRSNNNFPWFYQPQTVSNSENTVFDDFGFHTHNFLLEGEIQSPYMEDIWTLVDLEKFMKEYGLGDQVYNAHVNLFLQRDRDVVPHPHIDFRKVKHTVILYYVNDCDGDTIFYNKCENDSLMDAEEWKRESPKKGDFVVFDGSIYHSPCCPVENRRRCTLNFDCKVLDTK